MEKRSKIFNLPQSYKHVLFHLATSWYVVIIAQEMALKNTGFTDCFNCGRFVCRDSILFWVFVIVNCSKNCQWVPNPILIKVLKYKITKSEFLKY